MSTNSRLIIHDISEMLRQYYDDQMALKGPETAYYYDLAKKDHQMEQVLKFEIGHKKFEILVRDKTDVQDL